MLFKASYFMFSYLDFWVVVILNMLHTALFLSLFSFVKVQRPMKQVTRWKNMFCKMFCKVRPSRHTIQIAYVCRLLQSPHCFRHWNASKHFLLLIHIGEYNIIVITKHCVFERINKMWQSVYVCVLPCSSFTN